MNHSFNFSLVNQLYDYDVPNCSDCSTLLQLMRIPHFPSQIGVFVESDYITFRGGWRKERERGNEITKNNDDVQNSFWREARFDFGLKLKRILRKDSVVFMHFSTKQLNYKRVSKMRSRTTNNYDWNYYPHSKYYQNYRTYGNLGLYFDFPFGRSLITNQKCLILPPPYFTDFIPTQRAFRNVRVSVFFSLCFFSPENQSPFCRL